jgi:hypothetical protein
MVSTCSSVSVTTNMVSKENVQDQDDGNANKSPDALKKVGDKAPPDTDATLPLPTPKLARQSEDLQAHLSVFPNGHRCPSGDRLLAQMELELLKRGTE